jgi:tetratricopeptide (TPR) repeat protein
MKKQLFVACFYIIFICAVHSETTLPKSVVKIYVDDNNGNRIATGSGVVIAGDGLIATDIHLLLSWLGTKDNSLFVRAGENGYHPLETLIRLERDFGVAFFRISADDLNTVVPASDYNYAPEEKIYIAGDNEGFKTEPTEGTVSSIREDGVLELSVPTIEGLRGAPVLNSRGEATGIASVRDGVVLAVPINRVLEIASGGSDKARTSSAFDRARIKKAKAAVESNRASAEDYLRLGVAYEKAGIADNATQAFKSAIELKSDYAEAYHGLGIAYAGEGMYEEAAEALAQAVRINPEYAKAFGNLGFLYDYLGRYEEAISSFTRAIELNPEYAEAYNGLGVSYARERNYEEAIEAFRRALRIRPEFKKARFNLGLSYVNLGDKKSALHEEVLLRQLDPKMAGKLLELIPVEDEDKETDEEEIADDGDGDDA